MNGPEHYQAAESLLEAARQAVEVGHDPVYLQRQAEVHARLAAVAAQADPDRVMVTRAAQWRAVLS